MGRGLAAQAGRRGDHRRSRRPVLRRSGAGRAGRRFRRGRRRPGDRREQRRAHSVGPDDAVAPPAGVDLPRRTDLVRAQAICLTLPGEQQGDESEQLHRPDGPQLRGAADAGGRGARAVRQHGIAGDPRRRLPADAGRRQHHPARVLPAARLRDDPTGERATGRHPDPVLGVSRVSHPDGTTLRCHHRSAAHRPSGDELLRRPPSGSARTPSSANGRWTTSCRWNIRAVSKSAAT